MQVYFKYLHLVWYQKFSFLLFFFFKLHGCFLEIYAKLPSFAAVSFAMNWGFLLLTFMQHFGTCSSLERSTRVAVLLSGVEVSPSHHDCRLFHAFSTSATSCFPWVFLTERSLKVWSSIPFSNKLTCKVCVCGGGGIPQGSTAPQTGK